MATKCTPWKWDRFHGYHFLVRKCGKAKAAIRAIPDVGGVLWNVYVNRQRVASGSTKGFNTAKVAASKAMRRMSSEGVPFIGTRTRSRMRK